MNKFKNVFEGLKLSKEESTNIHGGGGDAWICLKGSCDSACNTSCSRCVSGCDTTCMTGCTSSCSKGSCTTCVSDCSSLGS